MIIQTGEAVPTVLAGLSFNRFRIPYLSYVSLLHAPTVAVPRKEDFTCSKAHINISSFA